MNKIYDFNLILFIFLGLICYLYFDPVLHPDSLGYINYDSVRSVGYSSIINLFGKNLEDNCSFTNFIYNNSFALFFPKKPEKNFLF